MLNVIILSVILLGIAVLLLGFNIFFRKGKSFPQSEIAKNEVMKKRGIKCTRHTALAEYREYYGKSKDHTGCSSCSCE